MIIKFSNYSSISYSYNEQLTQRTKFKRRLTLEKKMYLILFNASKANRTMLLYYRASKIRIGQITSSP